MRLFLSIAIAVSATGLLPAACGSSEAPSSAPSSRQPLPERLDCGKDRNGSRAAFRQFAEVLSRGDAGLIRSVLADRPRFGWISAHRRGRALVLVRKRPNEAARKVARRGGLPLEINRFMNIDRPSRTTDAGFSGSWGGRKRFVGKGAIDCRQGRAIVLSLAVRR